MRIRFYPVRFGLFFAFMFVFDRETEEISHALLGTNPPSLREVPSPKIRFSICAVRVLPTEHNLMKNNLKLSLVRK